jgi:Uncharacterized conserved protein
MSKFEITRRKNRQFQFNLKAKNGETILISEGYTAKHNCIKGIEAVRKNCETESRYEKRKVRSKRFYFTLKAANGQILCTSEKYTTLIEMDNDIESIKENAPEAQVVDLTVPK